MGLAFYVLAAMGLVLGVGWLFYVAPTPGPLSATTLMVALVPSISIVAGVCLILGVLWAAARLLRWARRLLRR